ncbi:hypothetical protein AWW66_01750 [Micromonospora rosaria]|uniref:HTH cro/C1-type domain-containing protein n=1 Tax=Micromonospora rosaria TaxID=47874 RepID=A0A136PZ17_9ACTN|nr:helix-turn-helix transcriptional regulator [Micromonospora rosaria]KXK63711.1 hypothetical protein AWW66_01750 [Micromonospora rosaria]
MGETETEFGTYLRARRARVDPEDAGLPRGRRRIEGLRREEVAALAGVSVDYYKRLEQGRERHPSTQLLGALSRVLRLTSEEQTHLHRLAGAGVLDSATAPGRPVSPALRRLLDQWETTPAFVYDDAQDILTANALGTALHAGFTRPTNFTRMIFLDPAGPRFFTEWDTIAAGNVAMLRRAWGRADARPRVQALVDDVYHRSAGFARLWDSHTVAGKPPGDKTFHHPAIGRIALTHHSFTVSETTGQHLLVYGGDPGTLALLRSVGTPVTVTDSTGEHHVG